MSGVLATFGWGREENGKAARRRLKEAGGWTEEASRARARRTRRGGPVNVTSHGRHASVGV